MSRKGSQMAKVPAPGAIKLSAFDVGHKHSRHRKDQGPNQQHRSAPKDSVQIQAASLDHSGCSSESVSSEEEAGGEDSDGDGLAADDDDDEDLDPDGDAPPGCAIDSNGRWAGMSDGLAKASKRDIGQSAADRAELKAHAEDSSNDEAYGAVDMISDSERDGSDMDCVEERAIIDSEDADAGKGPASLQTKSQLGRAKSPSESSENNWEGFDFGDGHLSDHQDFFDEQFNRTGPDSFLDGEIDILGNVDLFAEENLLFPASPPRRRVRFAEPLLEEDLFSPQATNNMRGDVALAAESDVAQDRISFSSDQPICSHGSDEYSDSSSGYESDYGETTDEDDVPASATARPQALMRRPSTSFSDDTSAKTTPTQAPQTQRWGPRMGSWCIDPTKPLAIVDSCGKKILVCPARRPKKPDRVFEHILGSGSTSANTSPRAQLSNLATVPYTSDIDRSEVSSQGLVSPVFGHPPAPSFGIANNGIFPDDTDDTGFLEDDALLYDDDDDNEDDDPEAGINIEDLIDFGDDGDESELDLTMGDSRPSSSSSAKTGFAGVGQSSSHSLLNHLDGTVVTAFRQTQLPAPVSLSPLSPLKKRRLSPPFAGPSKRRLVV